MTSVHNNSQTAPWIGMESEPLHKNEVKVVIVRHGETQWNIEKKFRVSCVMLQ